MVVNWVSERRFYNGNQITVKTPVIGWLKQNHSVVRNGKNSLDLYFYCDCSCRTKGCPYQEFFMASGMTGYCYAAWRRSPRPASSWPLSCSVGIRPPPRHKHRSKLQSSTEVQHTNHRLLPLNYWVNRRSVKHLHRSHHPPEQGASAGLWIPL